MEVKNRMSGEARDLKGEGVREVGERKGWEERDRGRGNMHHWL